MVQPLLLSRFFYSLIRYGLQEKPLFPDVFYPSGNNHGKAYHKKNSGNKCDYEKTRGCGDGSPEPKGKPS